MVSEIEKMVSRTPKLHFCIHGYQSEFMLHIIQSECNNARETFSLILNYSEANDWTNATEVA